MDRDGVRIYSKERNDVLKEIGGVLEVLKNSKPEGRSETSRRYAVAITEMEKVYAYFNTYVVEEFNIL